MFGSVYNELAKTLVTNVERKLEILQNSTNIISNVPQEQTTAQQLKDFKELLDMGILTQEEFDKKKAELLK